MQTFADIVEAFGGPARFADAIGVTANHAGVMKSRDSIPPEYWEKVVAEASTRGVEGVRFEVLARIAAQRKTAGAAA